MIASPKVIKRLFPVGLLAGSCGLLQLGAITIWLSKNQDPTSISGGFRFYTSGGVESPSEAHRRILQVKTFDVQLC